MGHWHYSVSWWDHFLVSNPSNNNLQFDSESWIALEVILYWLITDLSSACVLFLIHLPIPSSGYITSKFHRRDILVNYLNTCRDLKIGLAPESALHQMFCILLSISSLLQNKTWVIWLKYGTISIVQCQLY